MYFGESQSIFQRFLDVSPLLELIYSQVCACCEKRKNKYNQTKFSGVGLDHLILLEREGKDNEID
jgi:hypothetical protein